MENIHMKKLRVLIKNTLNILFLKIISSLQKNILGWIKIATHEYSFYYQYYKLTKNILE